MSSESIKARVEEVLCRYAADRMTMGEIIDRAGIDKRSASDVASALHKLRNQALVLTVRGPAKSPKGPRFVRLYQWRTQKQAQQDVTTTAVRVVFDPRANLARRL